MTLINFTKEELQKIEYYLLGETDPVVMDILEKIRELDDICECGSAELNWYIIQHKWGSYNVRWGNQNLYNYL